jgi:Uma2 family endonuclease
MHMAVADKLTIEDFETLPYALAHNHELVDGELVDVSGNTPAHILLRDHLSNLLWNHVRSNRLGSVVTEMEFAFGDNAHGPDISYFTPDKALLLEMHRRVQHFVPDFAVEVESRNDSFRSLVNKARRYLRYGTSEVWLLSGEAREVYCYSQQHDRILREHETLATSLIPGFSIRIADLFDQA